MYALETNKKDVNRKQCSIDETLFDYDSDRLDLAAGAAYGVCGIVLKDGLRPAMPAFFAFQLLPVIAQPGGETAPGRFISFPFPAMRPALCSECGADMCQCLLCAMYYVESHFTTPQRCILGCG